MRSAKSRARTALRSGGRAFVLSFEALAGSAVLFVLSLLSFTLIMLGLGLVTTPKLTEAVRKHADRRRLLAAKWSDIRIPTPYRPFPKDVRDGFTGQVERTTLILKDPATWRDLRWLLLDMTAGFVLLVFCWALLVYPVEGLVLAAGLWRVFEDDAYWYAFVPVDSQATGLARRPSASCSSSVVCGRASPCCGCTSCWHGRFWRPPRKNSRSASTGSPRPGTRPWTRPPPNCVASRGICTTGRRPGWSRWA